MRALFVILQAMLGLAVIALAWIVAAALIHDPNRLPSLGVALSRALQLAESDDYRQHLNASTSVLLFGLLPAIVVGILLGVLAGVSALSRWLLGPIISTLGAAPLIALTPMLLLWVGLGLQLTATVVAIATGFTVANAVMLSLGTRQGALSLAIVRGLRWGVVFGTTALVICEMLTARTGVGTFIMNAGALFDLPSVAAGIILLFVPVIAVAAILQAIEEQLAG
jgi:ABC-type nitrate/sulfonate/bicarbonate transport system permease component